MAADRYELKIHLSPLPSAAPPLNCVDLFSGAGGFSLAAQMAGFQIKGAVESDHAACTTYRRNFLTEPKRAETPHLFEEDILNKDLVGRVLDLFNQGESCDLLLGGPPCQGYSSHRINGAGIDDPRNQLILRYFEFVKALKPKFFLMENVPGMLWERHAPYLQTFLKQGREIGYQIQEPVVIDAQRFGIPQRRKRVFILGVRPDMVLNFNWPPTPTHGSPVDKRRSPHLKDLVPASVVFDRPLDQNDLNNCHMNHTEDLIHWFKRTPLDGGSRMDSGRMLNCHKNHPGHKDVYGRIDTKKPGPTMTTACFNPSKGRFLHPWEHHGITIRHAARFQTFPESFVFEGGLTAAGKQVGNAVPVELGRILLEVLKKTLETQNQPVDYLNKSHQNATPKFAVVRMCDKIGMHVNSVQPEGNYRFESSFSRSLGVNYALVKTFRSVTNASAYENQHLFKLTEKKPQSVTDLVELIFRSAINTLRIIKDFNTSTFVTLSKSGIQVKQAINSLLAFRSRSLV